MVATLNEQGIGEIDGDDPFAGYHTLPTLPDSAVARLREQARDFYVQRGHHWAATHAKADALIRLERWAGDSLRCDSLKTDAETIYKTILDTFDSDINQDEMVAFWASAVCDPCPTQFMVRAFLGGAVGFWASAKNEF